MKLILLKHKYLYPISFFRWVWKAIIKTKNWINANLTWYLYDLSLAPTHTCTYFLIDTIDYLVDANELLRKLYLSNISHLNSFSTSNNGFKKGWWPSKLLALAEVWSRRTSYIFSCSNLSWSCWSMKVVRQFIKGCWQLVGWYKDQNIPFGNSFSNIFISTWNKKQCL